MPDRQIVLFHYGEFQPLWHADNVLQCGPNIVEDGKGINIPIPSVDVIKSALMSKGFRTNSILLHYTDPFILRSAPLIGLADWIGPKFLFCGDLHHGNDPIKVLVNYHLEEFHDAVLLTFNPSLLDKVRKYIKVPVNSFPPSFFRYPKRSFNSSPILRLIHVGAIGPYHQNRREIVELIIQRNRIPFFQAITETPEEAADLYNQNALVLNIPLNNDLNHRFFEVMAAGSRQIIFGSQELLGDNLYLAERPDIFWVNSLDQLEDLVIKLLDKPSIFDKPVEPPPTYELEILLKNCCNYFYC